MGGILRGEIRWAKLDPVTGHEQRSSRPVLVLSDDVFNERSGTVIAVPLTSSPQRAGFPLNYLLNHPKLPEESWVKIGQIRTLSVLRLGKKIGKVEPEVLSRIIDGLHEIIGH